MRVSTERTTEDRAGISVRREVFGYSIARNGGIDEAGPSINSSCERLDVVKTLITEPHGDGEGTDAVVAKDDDLLFGVQLLMSPGGYVAHGHKDGAGQAGESGFPWLANVEQQGSVRTVALEGKNLRGDFGFKHDVRISCVPFGSLKVRS
jgi:hypothetical protein